MPPTAAVMVHSPTAAAVTVTLLPMVPERVTTFSGDTLHVTVFSVASAGRTEAVRVSVPPLVRDSVVLFRVTLLTGMTSPALLSAMMKSPAVPALSG